MLTNNVENDIMKNVGGLAFYTKEYFDRKDYRVYTPLIEGACKVLSSKTDKAIKLMLDIMNNTSFEDEKRIKELIKEKVSELSMLFINMIDNMNDMVENKIKKMEEKQKDIDTKLNILQTNVNEIENDIYDEEDGEYDFEIVCPYCNNEFVADINSEENTEIECPECHNIIELDWNEEECGGCCSGCDGCEEGHDSEHDEDNNDEDM